MRKYFKPFRLKLLAALLSKFLEAVFELTIPFILVSFIQNHEITTSIHGLTVLSFKIIGLVILAYLSSLICQIFASQIGHDIAIELREEMWSKLKEFDDEDYRFYSKDKINNYFTMDVRNIQEMISKVIRLAPRAPFLVIGSLFALYKIERKLTYYTLFFIPFLITLLVYLMRKNEKMQRKLQVFMDKQNDKIYEIEDGMPLVLAYQQEKAEKEKLNNLSDQYYGLQKKISNLYSLNPISTLLMNILLVYLIYLSGVNVIQGVLDPSYLIAISNYMGQILSAFVVLAQLILIFSKGEVSFQRVKEFLTYEKHDTEGEMLLEEPFHVEFDNVSYHDVKNHKLVLENINFAFSSHEKIGLFGLTGSGKSSVIDILLGFKKPSSGKVLINGLPIDCYSKYSLRENFDYISQRDYLLSDTIKNNIELYVEPEKKIYEVLQKMDSLDLYAKGESFKDLDRLSGGQKKRLQLSRALYHQRPFLILDDALSSLDNLRANAFFQSINRPMFLVSQKYSDLELCDRVYYLEEGKIIDCGPIDELRDRHEMVELMYRMQKGEIR